MRGCKLGGRLREGEARLRRQFGEKGVALGLVGLALLLCRVSEGVRIAAVEQLPLLGRAVAAVVIVAVAAILIAVESLPRGEVGAPAIIGGPDAGIIRTVVDFLLFMNGWKADVSESARAAASGHAFPPRGHFFSPILGLPAL